DRGHGKVSSSKCMAKSSIDTGGCSVQLPHLGLERGVLTNLLEVGVQVPEHATGGDGALGDEQIWQANREAPPAQHIAEASSPPPNGASYWNLYQSTKHILQCFERTIIKTALKKLSVYYGTRRHPASRQSSL